MIRVALVIAFTTIFSTAQIRIGIAAWGDGPGCGLGEMVFKSQPKSILMQLFGYTLNVPTQPLGITSGTSGCTSSSVIVKDEALKVFVGQNFDNILQDMARGQGEHLSSLALLMRIPENHQKEFFALAQELFRDLIQTKGASKEGVTGENTSKVVLFALQEALDNRSLSNGPSDER